MSRPESEASWVEARVGSVLRGKYRLDRVLGVGGMAAVYAARHRNGIEVAVKVLHPELTSRVDIRKRFIREGLAANALHHPSAVRVLDDDVADDGCAFLVMELLHGETVEAVWERCGNRLPLDTVLAVGVQLCDLLAAAHEHGIVHRDIKPQNLFLTVAGQLKVLDFGVAHLRDVTAGSATATGTMLGTPTFMSPEQAAGDTQRVGSRSDVYGAGATLFTTASGKLVHEGENPQMIVIKAATTHARSLATVMPEAPRGFIDVVDRALEFDPKQRWASAAEMRDALRLVYTSTFGPMPAAVPLPALTGLAWFRNDEPRSISNLTTSVPVALGDPPSQGPAAVSARPVRPPLVRWSRRWILRRAAGISLVAACASSLTYVSVRRHDGPPPAAASAPPPAVAVSVAPPPSSSALAVASTTTAPADPSSSALPSTTASAHAPTPSPRHARGRDCDPPFTVDARGRRHPRTDCP